MCEKCESKLGLNDNMSQSTYSFSTAYSVGKRKMKSDGDGGEPTDPIESKYRAMAYRKYVFGPEI